MNLGQMPHHADLNICSRTDWIKLLGEALDQEHVNAVKALMLSSYADSVFAMEHAIVQDNIELVRWLYEECAAPIDEGMLILAARSGHTTLFEYLESETSGSCIQGIRWPDDIKYIDSNIGADQYRFEEADDYCICKNRCDDQCINRASEVICTSINCRVGETCGNRFETNQNLIELFEAGGVKQLGVRARDDIPNETLIVEYVGEVITNQEVKRRDYPAYTMDLEGDLYIDAVHTGNLSRFINHHCEDTNCEPRRFWYGSTYRIGIIAKRDIQEGEEILMKYANELPFTCVCGSQRCVSK
jgi:SET domain